MVRYATVSNGKNNVGVTFEKQSERKAGLAGGRNRANVANGKRSENRST